LKDEEKSMLAKARRRKGIRFERRVKSFLEDHGWFCIRAAGSKPIDLVAWKDDIIWLVECKTGRASSAKEKEKIYNTLQLATEQLQNAVPVVARNVKRRIVLRSLINMQEVEP
jgi:Holliday junction resolvase